MTFQDFAALQFPRRSRSLNLAGIHCRRGFSLRPGSLQHSVAATVEQPTVKWIATPEMAPHELITAATREKYRYEKQLITADTRRYSATFPQPRRSGAVVALKPASESQRKAVLDSKHRHCRLQRSCLMDPTSVINPADLSIQHLVSQADPVVKAILVLLVVFSVWCWSVMLEKLFQFLGALRAVERLEATLERGKLEDVINYSDAHPLTSVIAAGNAEWHEGSGEHEHESLHEVRERIEHAMRLQISVELRRISKRLPFLATVGSSAPFIGLFGTVWGIMNTFTGIAGAHDTSLATVAPGIAEALIATGIGLAAAIPSIMAYNSFATHLGRYSGRVNTAVGVYANRLSKRFAPAALAAASSARKPVTRKARNDESDVRNGVIGAYPAEAA
jgi:TolQ protein